MTDYRPLLARAIANLDPNTGEARRAVYDRARTALVNQLRGLNPPLAESEITKQRLALEEAIRLAEGDATQPASVPPPRPPAREPASARPAREAPGSRTNPAGPPAAYDDGDPFTPDTPPSRPQVQARDPRGRQPDPRARGPHENDRAPTLRPRPGRGKTPADYARDDARRAVRTRLVVGGIVGALFLLAALVGYVHRERIYAAIGMGSTTTSAEDDGPKTPDRIAPDPTRQQTQNQQAPRPAPQTGPVAGAPLRAFLFEENPGNQQVTTFNGATSWSTETISPGPGRAPELGIRINVEIPDRRLNAVITLRRNPDPSLPASHYIEVQFVSANDPYGGIAQMPGVRVKNNEAAQGIPLAGLSVTVMQGFFLFGLSAVDVDRDRNLQLLKLQSWLDIPFVYANGRRAVLTFEKGAAGEKAIAEALAAWGTN